MSRSGQEADGLGLVGYQWVPLQMPGRPLTRALFQGGRESPPFVLLNFEHESL